jgi:hypothetical protein
MSRPLGYNKTMLQEYKEKRDFKRTPEPQTGKKAAMDGSLIFIV